MLVENETSSTLFQVKELIEMHKEIIVPAFATLWQNVFYPAFLIIWQHAHFVLACVTLAHVDWYGPLNVDYSI